ncbi:MAG: prepilin-type N-terminal cleavage/methylation domain-containing protein [Deltaproteobacteria bacterium]|nr:prepilin-type N-terminal cleavage/methylation domain-containing protein [Deltaproteobacteria bacterium]
MKRKKTFSGANEKGFTLIEALIALAIFSIGILGVATMQITAINSNTIARLQTEAAALATNRMERLHRLDYTDANLSNGPHGPETEGAYRVAWSVVNNQPVNWYRL